MTERQRPCLDRRGVAALEFALVVPLVLLMFGGAAELGLAVWARGILANAVSQGAYYAFLNQAATAATIKNLVQNVSTLSGVTASVTTPAAYCVSGSPATLTAPPSSNVCPDLTKPGTYTTISASYAMISILPAFTDLSNMTLQESVTVRLK